MSNLQLKFKENIMLFKRKYSAFFKELLVRDSRLAIIDRYTWKIFKIISPYQINFMPLITWRLVGQGRLPSLTQRIEETQDPTDDFIIKDIKEINKIDKDLKVNVILKGIKPNILKQIDKSLVTYIVNMNDESIFSEFKKIIQISADQGIVDGFLGSQNGRVGYKETKNKIVFLSGDALSEDQIKNEINSNMLKKFYYLFNINNSIKNKNRLHIAVMKHNINISRHSMGSGLWVILYLLKRYKFVNIYGWDQYRSNPICKNSTTKFIKDIWETIGDITSNKEIIKAGGAYFVPKKFFCSFLFSYIYCYKILTSEKLKNRYSVQGHVSNIKINNNVMCELKKIIYK